MGRIFIAALIAVAVGLLAFPALALANGVPKQVSLSYLPGISNYGPRNAAGIGEVVAAEGEVNVKVTGLPHLEGDAYGVWLLNTATSEALFAGSFNTDATASASLHSILPQEIPDRGYNLVLVTVEPKDKAGKLPDARHSIAGYFSMDVPSGLRPAELPRTGGEGDLAAKQVPGIAGGLVWVLLAGGLLGVVGAARFLARRHP